MYACTVINYGLCCQINKGRYYFQFQNLIIIIVPRSFFSRFSPVSNNLSLRFLGSSISDWFCFVFSCMLRVWRWQQYGDRCFENNSVVWLHKHKSESLRTVQSGCFKKIKSLSSEIRASLINTELYVIEENGVRHASHTGTVKLTWLRWTRYAHGRHQPRRTDKPQNWIRFDFLLYYNSSHCDFYEVHLVTYFVLSSCVWRVWRRPDRVSFQVKVLVRELCSTNHVMLIPSTKNAYMLINYYLGFWDWQE